jgi:hypothetical protein
MCPDSGERRLSRADAVLEQVATGVPPCPDAKPADLLRFSPDLSPQRRRVTIRA